MTPAYALAHVFLPNFTKRSGATSVISAIERKEKLFFQPIWAQAHVTHDPALAAMTRDGYRIAVMALPVPTEMGEAFFVGWAVKQGDPHSARYFTLEHDYVLAKRANRTVLCERDGAKHTKLGDGPAMTGDFTADAASFVGALMERIVPTKVTRA